MINYDFDIAYRYQKWLFPSKNVKFWSIGNIKDIEVNSNEIKGELFKYSKKSSQYASFNFSLDKNRLNYYKVFIIF